MSQWLGTGLSEVIAEREAATGALVQRVDAAPVRFDPSYVSRHDVVYLRANNDWRDGLPFGNGNVGGVVCFGEALNVYLDKTDLWHYAEDLQPGPSGRTYAARLSVGFAAPLDEGAVEQRLDLLGGEVRVRSGKDPLKAVSARILALADCNVIVLDLHHPPECEPDVQLLHPEAAQSQAAGDLVLERDLGYQRYRVQCRLVPLGSGRTRLLVALASRVESGEDLATPCTQLLSQGPDEPSHRAWWRTFWSRSAVSIPDPVVENLWYLSQYRLACTSRAVTPAGFSGLWYFGEGVRPWSDAYVTDAQHPIIWWPCLSSNHAELLGPYLELWRDLRQPLEGATWTDGMSVPHAFWPLWAGFGERLRTRRDWAAVGGLQDARHGGTAFNVIGAWIAQLFWSYYRHTLDRSFLKEIAYPFMKSALDFVETTLTRDEKGFVHNTCGSPELPPEFGCTDSAFGRALAWRLLTDTLQASGILEADEEDRTRWLELLEHLALYPVRGGAICESADLDHPHRCHPSVLCCVYPACEVDADHPLSEAAGETLRIATRYYAHRDPGHRGLLLGENPGGGEINCFFAGQSALMWARLGRGDECLARLYNPGVRHLMRPTGMWVIWPGYRGMCESEDTGLSLAELTINEMLLQVRRGTEVHIFPAVPSSWKDATFQNLRVEGGFIVSAARRNGACAWVQIISLEGGTLRLKNPFAGDFLIEDTQGAEARASESPGEQRPEWIERVVRPGEQLLLSARRRRPRPDDRRAFELEVLTGESNLAPKSVSVEEVEARYPTIVAPKDPPIPPQDFGDGRVYLGMPSPGVAPHEPDTGHLLPDVRSPDWRLRHRAALKLAGGVGRPYHRAAVEALVSLSRDAEPLVRCTAVASLAAFKDDPAAFSALREALEHGDEESRRQAEWILGAT